MMMTMMITMMITMMMEYLQLTRSAKVVDGSTSPLYCMDVVFVMFDDVYQGLADTSIEKTDGILTTMIVMMMMMKVEMMMIMTTVP